MSTHDATTPPTKEECLQAAGEAFANALARLDARTPRAAAEAAYVAGGPSVDEIEQRIIASRQRRYGSTEPTDASQPPG